MQNLEQASENYLNTLLTSCRVFKNWHHVYAVGSFDHKKTVATQQTRSAAVALGIAKILGDESIIKIAVIGAGFAGLTAAATLVKLGHTVTVYEEKNDLIPVQKNCIDRYLHPNLYDWPLVAPQGEFSIAGLNWRAHFATEVVKKITKDFSTLQSNNTQKLLTQINTEIVKIEENSKYTLYDHKNKRIKDFDAVIIAAGFGREKSYLKSSNVCGYWEQSIFSYANAGTKQRPYKVLISGNGDGGLMEVLHAAIKDFNHSNIVNYVMDFLTEDMFEKLIKIETDINSPRAQNPAQDENIIHEYDEYFEDHWDGWRNKIFDNARPNGPIINTATEITFNHTDQGVFSRSSAPINRFLVYILIRTDVINSKIGYIDQDSIEQQQNEDGPLTYAVKWGQDENESYDRIVIRHGVIKDYFRHKFRKMDQEMIPDLGAVARLNLIEAMPDEILQRLKEL